MLSETEQQPLATAIALSAIATGLRSVRSAPCPNRFSDDAAFQRITLVGSELEQSPSVRRENMPPSVHRSTAEKFLIVVSCVLCFCLPTPSLAQRPIARPAGGVVHTPAPPISHTPIFRAPIIHAPISTARTSGVSFGMPRIFPRRPIRRFPPVFILYESPAFLGGPFWAWNSCAWASCDLFWPWTFDYTTVSSPGPINYVYQPYPTPADVYGEERPDLPQLFLKDGTVLNVADYWLVDDQLHFTMIEDEGGKPVEHVIPFDALDLQRTVDVNTGRGFRFMLRNEPFEQYLRDHPEGPPPVIAPSHH